MNISSMGSGNMAAMQKMQSQMQAQMFSRADKNGSGGLDKAEFKQLAANAPSGAGSSEDVTKAFEKIDTDGDGNVTAAELDKGAKDAMKSFQGTLATFGTTGDAASTTSVGSASSKTSKTSDSGDSSSDLIMQLLSQLQTKYSAASTAESNPLSMFA